MQLWQNFENRFGSNFRTCSSGNFRKSFWSNFLYLHLWQISKIILSEFRHLHLWQVSKIVCQLNSTTFLHSKNSKTGHRNIFTVTLTLLLMTKAHSYLNPGSYLPAFNWVTFNHHACSDCLFRSPPSPHTGRPRPTESKTIPSQPDMFSGLGRAITHKSRSQVYREVKLQLNHLPTLDLVYSVCTLQFSTAGPDSKSVDPRLLVHVHYTVKRPFTWLSYRNTFEKRYGDWSYVLQWVNIQD